MSNDQLSTGCPHEEIRPVSKSDSSLGNMAICKKFQGRCAYYNNIEEYKKIGADYKNCPLFKTFN